MAISNDKQQINHKKSYDENGLNENGKEKSMSTTLDSSLSNDLKSAVEMSTVLNHEFGPNFIILPTNNQIKELQTVIRDKYVGFYCAILGADCLKVILTCY